MKQNPQEFHDTIARNVSAALDEDVGTGDLTAQLIPSGVQAEAWIIAREPAVLCGQPWFNEVFRQVDPMAEISWLAEEGTQLQPDQKLVTIRGEARSLVTAERSALNFLQLLSGTATVARQHVDAVAGTHTHVVDSRKTVPGLRIAQKYAIRIGGGHNHRVGLYDGILIKENHIATAGGVSAALAQAAAVKQQAQARGNPFAETAFVQIEVETLEQLREALEAGARMILLDNMETAQIREAVSMNAGRAVLEVSGGVSLGTLRGFAELGVDRISIGGLTKHVRAIDFSMRMRQL